MWFDSHCHVTADAFAEDRADVLDRAAADGVEGFIAIGSGYGVARNADAVALAASDARVWAAVGVHPHEADELDDAGRAELEALLERPRVVAVGRLWGPRAVAMLEVLAGRKGAAPAIDWLLEGARQ